VVVGRVAFLAAEAAPVGASAGTDHEGNYSLSGIRYGTSTTFEVTPSGDSRRFEPAFKTITLSRGNPVQNEVDERVLGVREIWNDPARVTVKADGSMKSILLDIEKVNAEMQRLRVDTSEFERSVAALTIYLDRPLTIRNYFTDPGELAQHEYDRRVMEWNEKVKTVSTELERKQVRITNEYRMMMGRRALLIDDRLVKTARGHCEEMQRLGYFSHFSPVPERRTPDLRAKLEGYEGSAISENIHRGSGAPEGAHNGWTHSSGHHRNLLQRFWTEMGTGQSGNTWTQNFGRTKPKEFPEEEEK